jgi:DNA-binding transcriptional MerR regulator
MTVGQLAEATGVPPSRIRYYEKVGVLPAPARTPSGYRAYGEEAVARLAFLQRGKTLGLRLGEIAELLRAADEGCCDAAEPLVLQRLEDRLAEVDRRIAQLRALRRQLEAALGRRVGPARPPALDVELACANGPTPCPSPDGEGR